MWGAAWGPRGGRTGGPRGAEPGALAHKPREEVAPGDGGAVPLHSVCSLTDNGEESV